jgi:hypothetical protein
MSLPPFKTFRSTVNPFTPADAFVSRIRLLVDPISGAPSGVLNLNSTGPDGQWTPVDLTAAQIAAPTAEMLEDLNSTFRLNEAPYTRYISTGTALVAGGGGGGGQPPFSSFTVNTVVANAIDAPAGTTWIVCNDAVNEVQDITIDGTVPADGYDLVIAFPNGTAAFAGQPVSAGGNATLTTVGGAWTVVVRAG